MKSDLNNRKAGILLPIFSLPGAHGIGDLGKSAFEFVEIVHAAGFAIWQVLPVSPSSEGNSPYTPYSSYAGDEIYISLEYLVKDNLLDRVVEFNENATRVDYQKVRSFKDAYLRLAFANFKFGRSQELLEEYRLFKNQAFWLDGYARFMAASRFHNKDSWTKWPGQWQTNCFSEILESEQEYQKFVQFIFFRQFSFLKEWANQHQVSIMGDIPFYVGMNSADVYFNKQAFMLDERNNPQFVSGAAPDYFSSSGQRWGHPIYNWDYLKLTGYRFWRERLDWNSKLFDILRIDHFRAFDTYWKIPASDHDAINGQWVAGPGSDFFKRIYEQLPDLDIVVEDLGELRNEVHQLRDEFNLMGMRIIQYGFGRNEADENYRIPKRAIAYSGTHDNNTLSGWADELSITDKFAIDTILDDLGCRGNDFVEKTLYRTLACEASIAIVQLQDILGLSGEARVNLPGTVGEHNWTWKLASLEAMAAKIKETKQLLKMTNRI